MTRELITRRTALLGVTGAGALALSACDKLSNTPSFFNML